MTRLYRHATLAEGQAGIEGQPAAGADITTAGALNNASTVTPFGRGVIVSGAVDDLPVIALPSAASNVIFGVTLYSFSYERTADTTDADGFFGYPIKGTTTIATRGLIFVVPESLERHAEPLMRAPEEQRNGSTFIPIFKCITPVMINYPDSISYFDVLNAAA